MLSLQAGPWLLSEGARLQDAGLARLPYWALCDDSSHPVMEFFWWWHQQGPFPGRSTKTLQVTAFRGGRCVAGHTPFSVEEAIPKVIKGSGAHARLPPLISTETQVKLITRVCPSRDSF